MEDIPLDVQLAELLSRDRLADRVTPPIEPRANDQAAAVRRVRDQIDDGLVGAQRTAAPVDGDKREQPVLNLVPLAGPRLSEQLCGQHVGALAGPAQRRLGVTSRHWIYELLERRPCVGMGRLEGALAGAAAHVDDV